MKPLLGDHLAVQRLGYTHHGIYIGHQQVIHYQGPFSGDGEENRITLSSLWEFHCGQPLRIIAHQNRAFSRQTCVDRAHSRLGENNYHLLFNNCEHFVEWCIEDRHDSSQVNHAAATLALAGAASMKSGPATHAVVSGLLGVSISTTNASITGSSALSVAAISSAPAWAPLAVGVAVVYSAHRLFKWLNDD